MSLLDRITYRRVGELRYAVREAGSPDGAPFFLLHGLLDTGAGFAPLVDALETRLPGRYRYIAPDWRGHGESEARNDSYWFPEYLLDLERLIDSVVADPQQPVILLGHSMGGQATSQYAGVRPRRVSHLITLDSLNVRDADPAHAPQRYRRWLDAQASPRVEHVFDSIEAIAQRIGRRYPELDDGQRALLAEQWSAPVDAKGRRRLKHDAWHRVTFPYGFRATEAMALWREVTAAVLCVDAGHSTVRLFAGDEEMARRRACFANLRHVVLPRCGHMLHIQRPAALADEIRAFLQAQSAT